VSLPENHPQRFLLANEVHARPQEALQPPVRVSYLAVAVEPDSRHSEYAHVEALCGRYGAHPPPADATHFTADLGPFRVAWERHTEFTSYTFTQRGAATQPFTDPAIRAVPAEWVAGIPGRTVVAVHADVLERTQRMPDASVIAAYFEGNYVVGAGVGGGGGALFTDFRVHADGFGRILLIDRELSRRQVGRTLQRMFEIETYRVMALLALPIARAAAPRVRAMEGELGDVTAALAGGAGTDDALLERLTALAAKVESAIGESRFRFGATAAYYDLVTSRIAELREQRLPGTQTVDEFMARRLAPAMATCESVARRMVELSERVARANDLLATRVGIVRERQNQELLASMDRRARLQLRLQETVEGLSVAAITYYVVGLVAYAAKALDAAGAKIDVEITVGVSIPVVLALVALGVRFIRRRLVRAEQTR
jgi:uncharacterized membrane-anchored protein